MFVRVANESTIDFEKPVLVYFLLGWALRDDEHLRVFHVYKEFQAIIEASWSPDLEKAVKLSVDKVRKITAS